MKDFWDKNVHLISYGFISCFALVWIIEAFLFEPHDFSNYYFAGSFLKDGIFDSSIYFPHSFNLAIAAQGTNEIYTSYAPHSPFLALFFSPFSLVSLPTAKLIFNLLSWGLFLFSLRNLVRLYPIKPIFLFVLPILFFIPFRNNFLFGQLYFLLFFLLVEGFIAYKKERYWRMSFFWGIAVLLKIIPIILFGFLFFKQKWRGIFYFGAACLVLTGISVLVSGVEVWVFYFTKVLPKSGAGEITTEFVQNYQSVFMFLKGLLSTKERLFLTAVFAFKLVLLVISFFVTRHEKSDLKIIVFWVMASVLLSPYGSTYTAILLVISYIYFVNKPVKNQWYLLAFCLLIGLISNLPIHYFNGLSPILAFPRMFLMLGLFGFLFWNNIISLPVWKGLRLVVLGAIAYLFLVKIPVNLSNELFPAAPLLTYDYGVKEGKLVYTSWGQTGPVINETSLEVSSLTTEGINLKNNQLFIDNELILATKDNLLKPAILNDTTLIYLSDYKRGIGFYQLRVLKL
jgi:hypothetical protein